jgi:hypothetical protein
MRSSPLIETVLRMPLIPKIAGIGGDPGVHGAVEKKHLHLLLMTPLEHFPKKRIPHILFQNPTAGKGETPGLVIKLPAGYRIPLNALIKARAERLKKGVSRREAVGSSLEGFGIFGKIPHKRKMHQSKRSINLLLLEKIPPLHPAFPPVRRKKVLPLQCKKIHRNLGALQILPTLPDPGKLTVFSGVPLYGLHHAGDLCLQEGNSFSPGVDLNGGEGTHHPHHRNLQPIYPGNIRHPGNPKGGHKRSYAVTGFFGGTGTPCPGQSDLGRFLGGTLKKNCLRNRVHRGTLLCLEILITEKPGLLRQKSWRYRKKAGCAK